MLTEEEVYETAKGGPGQDIYNKGAWILHTLRWLIGDKDFWDVTRLEVYGRTDPKPGNFAPRYGSTREYQGFVKKVTGKDYDWFFDVYLRRAALPELIEARSGDKLTLLWLTPDNLPFPDADRGDGRRQARQGRHARRHRDDQRARRCARAGRSVRARPATIEGGRGLSSRTA